MCGIIAVLRRRSDRANPSLPSILDRLDEAVVRMGDAVAGFDGLSAGNPNSGDSELRAVTELLQAVDRELRGPPGVSCLLSAPEGDGAEQVAVRGVTLAALADDLEQTLDTGKVRWSPAYLEALNETLVGLRDVIWAVGRDRPGMARAVAGLGRLSLDRDGHLPPAARDAFWSIQVALSAIDRLEVRGRDSAGLHLLVTGHGIDLQRPEVEAMLGTRANDALFTSMAVRTPEGQLSLVYKAAAEIGELGDNTRALRAAIAADPLLSLALASPEAEVTVLGHTRWASVGIISQANAHPLNGEELTGLAAPYVVGAVNGDVDNYLDLRDDERLSLAPEITTDTKVVPVLLSRQLAQLGDMEAAFCQTVATFDGSVAIGVSAAASPDHLYLALRGSGQSLNVGFAEDAFIVASEAYGLVQETASYLRMDGETAPMDTGAGPGQVVILDRSRAGTAPGVRRLRYDGAPHPLEPSEIRIAEITTRDIDRGGFPHFLLKEISEAPQSFRKTLRGKIFVDEHTGLLTAGVGPRALPPVVIDALASGAITRIHVIGQGTAAVAGQSIAASIAAALKGRPITVTAMLATELSGFALADDMSDALVIAVSQSGTTTDTNRTVDLVRNRGAVVVAVVNRRNSDLVEKSDGVLYTSDGRDVEMSVASTKAFYAQVAAGFLLALDLARQLGAAGNGKSGATSSGNGSSSGGSGGGNGHGGGHGGGGNGGGEDRQRADRLLRALRQLPDAMEEVLAGREAIADAANRIAPYRRHWAVVGNGPNRVAAAEIRIKLSELCYHSIACDGTEDKKHIDLSSEPLILVCATGLSGPTADDVAKEVAIYRAHRAAPIVVATRGQAARFGAALHTIEVPAVEPEVAFVLSAMVGHLFGYEAALSIDAQALPLREAKAAIEAAVGTGPAGPLTTSGDALLTALRPALDTATSRFFHGLRAGSYNGHLEAGTAVRVASLLRYASGVLPIEGYELEYGKVGTPSAIVADLLDALTTATGELTRPVDAIKHQAKTVTVGISRSEDALLKVPLVAETLATGVGLDCLSYRALRTLSELDTAVAAVQGFTRYRIDGDLATTATIEVVDRGGISLGLASRTERDPRLLGTKHHVASEREVTVARGGRDGRSLILIPETKGNAVTGMTLLHVAFHDRLSPAAARQVLSGYRNRYAALADAVTETESGFDDERLAAVPLLALLTEPVYVLAERWKG
jgi:glucosamine--fructose-6-phosphate aminotransferase (isomerizing)